MIKNHFYICELLFNLGIGNSFLIMTQNEEILKEKIDKFDYTKRKCVGEKHHRQSLQTTDKLGENIDSISY